MFVPLSWSLSFRLYNSKKKNLNSSSCWYPVVAALRNQPSPHLHCGAASLHFKFTEDVSNDTKCQPLSLSLGQNIKFPQLKRKQADFTLQFLERAHKLADSSSSGTQEAQSRRKMYPFRLCFRLCRQWPTSSDQLWHCRDAVTSYEPLPLTGWGFGCIHM